ncbi:MAG: helix-turn-helix transcriptional regulator [Clostridia bacterium]|jgi:transcriptional regulator with XRE-family HTH domain|nr:helix-turn-helix transcriptional regulator [Clostridia bacterium]
MEGLAQKLKDLRLEKGLDKSEVSKLLGLSKNAFGNYEAGIREPSLDILKRICIIFDVSSDYLLGLEN